MGPSKINTARFVLFTLFFSNGSRFPHNSLFARFGGILPHIPPISPPSPQLSFVGIPNMPYTGGAIAASSDPRRLKMMRQRCGREEAVGGCSCSRLGVIAASSDPRRLKMRRRRCGREEAVGGCSCSRLGVIAASSDPRRLKMRRRRVVGRRRWAGARVLGWVSSRRHLTPGG